MASTADLSLAEDPMANFVGMFFFPKLCSAQRHFPGQNNVNKTLINHLIIQESLAFLQKSIFYINLTEKSHDYGHSSSL